MSLLSLFLFVSHWRVKLIPFRWPFVCFPLILRPWFWTLLIQPSFFFWLIEYSSPQSVATRRSDTRSAHWGVGSSHIIPYINSCWEWSTPRMTAFITVNVDDVCVFPGWHNVVELSGLHNHWLSTAVITFKLTNANILVMCIRARVARRPVHEHFPGSRQVVTIAVTSSSGVWKTVVVPVQPCQRLSLWTHSTAS